MRLTVCRFLAATNLIFFLTFGSAASRPRYGGALQVEMRASVASLDPAEKATSQAEEEGKEKLVEMVFDRLVGIGEDGAPQPRVAISWTHDAENKRWKFSLRPGVKWQDGSALSPENVASSVKFANPGWQVSVLGEVLEIETASPMPGLPAELALARNSVVSRAADGTVVGTGPFLVAEWQPGRRAVLAAYDEYWGGRPYVDTIEIEMGRLLREQLIDLELGKADVVEIGLDQVRRAAQEGQKTVVSSPAELMALRFVPARPSVEDARLREALALSIDRTAIHAILLQRQGEPAAGLLPQWLSGYAFLFPATGDPVRAKQLRAELASPPTFALGYDAADPLARAVADRIAVNARDAGISVQVVGEGPEAEAGVDVRLLLSGLCSTDPRTALAGLARFLQDPAAQTRAESVVPEDLYEVETAMLEGFRVIPLFHLPEVYGLSPRVRDWTPTRTGGWRLEDVWLDAGNP